MHGTQKTLRICTAIERIMEIKSKDRNSEMKRPRTYNVMWWCVHIVRVALVKLYIYNII